MYKVLDFIYSAEKKITATIDSCYTIEQLESACNMANNYGAILEKKYIGHPFRFFGRNPLKWLSDYKLYKKVLEYYVDFKIRTQQQIDEITMDLTQAPLPPEKVIVTGFRYEEDMYN